jgi:succinate dehydrogenase (ubiquinone) membrane anchor subunit
MSLLRGLRFVPSRLSFSAITAPSKALGSYHWNFERGLSVITVPLLAVAFVSPLPLVDFALGFVLPLHCHFGFDCMITDYLPVRRTKYLNLFCTWLLKITTLLSIYGCYLLNTYDVGMTQFMKNLWNGPEKVTKNLQ